jgi:hypothetical protein
MPANVKRNPVAVAQGWKGGKKGGPARAAKLTPEQRSESARKAVQARWGKGVGSHVNEAKAAGTVDRSMEQGQLMGMKMVLHNANQGHYAEKELSQ